MPGSTVHVPGSTVQVPESTVQVPESTSGTSTAPGSTVASGPRIPLEFEPNLGRSDPGARYLGRGNGMTLMFFPDGVLFAAGPAAARLRFVDANPRPRIVASDRRRGSSHYLLGDDPRAWRSDVPRFATLRYVGVYPGIDVVFRDNGAGTEYDFVVAPGSDPGRIRLALDGADELRLGASGERVATYGPQRMSQRAPVVFQEVGSRRVAVDGSWKLHPDGSVGFEVGPYDPTRELVVDPVVEFATYVGGNGIDQIEGIAVDDEGYIFLVGRTFSVNFPVESPLDSNLSGSSDVFVTKMDPSGRHLIFSTYLGGSGSENGLGIALGPTGDVYVGGTTDSTDFPTVSPLQNSLAGGLDAFVTRLDPTGSVVELSTYLGSSGGDGLGGLSVDRLGAMYVSGLVQGADFPVTMGVFQSTYGGGGDVYVTKIGNAGNLEYSSYLGGTGFDTGGANAIDSDGDLYVAGGTDSTDFPVQNALDDTYGGGNRDGFVARISHVPLTTGATLEWSTYLGGSESDSALAIALDASRNVHVAGSSGSVDFPVDDDLDSTLDGFNDGFATKLDPTGTSILYSTFLGGSSSESVRSLALDRFGQAHLAGDTTSADFPVLSAVQPALAGGQDDFVLKLTIAGDIVWSTYVGGSDFEGLPTLALDDRGGVLVGGQTSSSDFPTQRALDTVLSGPSDAFVVKLVSPAQYFIGALMRRQLVPLVDGSPRPRDGS